MRRRPGLVGRPGRARGTLARRTRALAALVVLACEDPVPPYSPRLDILAVRAEPPEARPGQRVELTLVHEGMVQPVFDADREGFSIVWFGGCINPPSLEYYGCIPSLHALAAELPERLTGDPSLASRIGLGQHYSLTLPEAALLDTNSGRRGVAYVFFAVCRGRLELALELEDQLPVRCLDDAGHEVDADGLATGFTTIPISPMPTNHNPTIRGVTLDGQAIEALPCAFDEDCPAGTGAGWSYGCSSARVCSPALAVCDAKGPCPARTFELEIDLASAELLGGGAGTLPRETLGAAVYSPLDGRGYASIYPGRGDHIERRGFRLAGPRAADFDELGEIPVIALVQDDRGGRGLAFFQLLRQP